MHLVLHTLTTHHAPLFNSASLMKQKQTHSSVAAAGAAPSSPSVASCSTSSLTSSQYTRIISKQAEADERPLEPVSELKQWLMAPSADNKNRTLAADAAAERERAERKLINKLSKRMTREEAVKTARSYLRRISDQASCDELPLMHVSEAQSMLREFERKNREHFEKHSVKPPNKMMSRKEAEKEEAVEEASAQQPEDKVEDESELEDSTVDIDSASLNLSVDGVSEKADEEEEEDDGDESTKMEQPSVDSVAVESKAESKDDEVDGILEEAVSDFSAVGGPGTVQRLEGIAHQHHGLVISYDKSSRSLVSESTSGPVDSNNAMQVPDPTNVFRKRYPTDAFEEDLEEAERPKKLQRGLDALKCLACPNPVKAMLKDAVPTPVKTMLKDGVQGWGYIAEDAKDAMKTVKANLTGNLTMTSSADMEDVAASRRNLGAKAVAKGGYEALESPCDSQLTFDDSVAMSANGIYGIQKPAAQFHFSANAGGSGNVNGYSPSNESAFSGSSDGLPKTNMLTVSAANAKPTESNVIPDHLLFLGHQFSSDNADLSEC